jgi:hypothetical protein
MTTTDARFTGDDIAYIESAYHTLDELARAAGLDPAWVVEQIAAGLLPEPAYTLPVDRRLFPPDYFTLLETAGSVGDLRTHFDARFRKAARAAGLAFTPEWNPETEWVDYIDGTYWVCLWEATPEAMIEKERLIRAIRALDAAAEPSSAAWCAELAEAVDALDALERPFTDYDRARWDYTSRGLYVTAMRERYPEAF